MTLFSKRLLYGFVIILFSVCAPLLALYASGYRFDSTLLSISKVGALYLKSYPAEATILLDDTRTGKTTPNRLLNVAPGMHRVTVLKPPYAPWTKELEVAPGGTTFARDIVMFIDTPAPRLISEGGTDVLAPPNSDLYAAIASTGDLIVTSMNRDSAFRVPLPSPAIRLYDMNTDGSLMLYQDENGIRSVDLNAEKVSPVAPKLPAPKKALFDPHANVVWMINNAELISLDLATQSAVTHLADVADFAFNNSETAVLRSESGSIQLQMYGTDRTQPTESYAIEGASDPRIAYVTDATVVVREADSLMLIDRDGLVTTQRFTAHDFDLNGNRLLYTNGIELRIIDLTTREDLLIDRTSNSILFASWHPSGSYILHNTNGRLEFIELDGRDHRNTTTVVDNASTTARYIFDRKGEKLFQITPTENVLYGIQ